MKFLPIGSSQSVMGFSHLLVTLPFVAFFAVGCAHRGDVSSTRQGLLQHQIEPRKIDWVANGVTLENRDFDLPVTINTKVERWIEYFTGPGRRHFEKYLKRSEYFIPYIRPILQKNRMPEDLVYLAMIESGFNNHAYSRSRAVGPWQFISSTGRRYGLKINWWVDERRNIEKSTIAAVNYLSDLYRMFGNWELAAAGYNAGETKVSKAIRRFGTKDYWTMSRYRYLKAETRNYVPKMYAAAILSKNRTQFGFEESYLDESESPPIAEAVPFPIALSQEDLAEVENDRQAELMGPPAENREPSAVAENATDTFEPDQDYPQGEASLVDILKEYDEEYAKLPSGKVPARVAEPDSMLKATLEVPTPHVNKNGELDREKVIEFEIQSPADLLRVARAAGMSFQKVKALNPEILRWCTPPGVKSHMVKLPESVKEQFLMTYNHPAYPRDVTFKKYKVRRGDSLRRIARRFGISQQGIKDLNGIRRNRDLRAGKTIRLPIPADRKRSLAELDLKNVGRKRYQRYRKRFRTIDYKQRKAARFQSEKKL